jgi:hypothetical protein
MFLTKEIEKLLPDYNEYHSAYRVSGETKVPLKFFAPIGAATWYIVAYDREHRIFYGFCDLYGDGINGEWGAVARDELEFLTLRMGLMIERDRHWRTRTVGELTQKGLIY